MNVIYVDDVKFDDGEEWQMPEMHLPGQLPTRPASPPPISNGLPPIDSTL